MFARIQPTFMLTNSGKEGAITKFHKKSNFDQVLK